MPKKIKYYKLARGYAWRTGHGKTLAVFHAHAKGPSRPEDPDTCMREFRVQVGDPAIPGQEHKLEPVYEEPAPAPAQKQYSSPKNRAVDTSEATR